MNIKINSKQAKPIVERTFPEYKGRKFIVEFCEKVTFHDTNCGGGTVNKYVFVGMNRELTFNAPAPWNNPVEGKTIDLPENLLIVEHSMFCGKDCGITIYAHPKNAPKILPQS